MPPPDDRPRFAAPELRRFFTAVDANLSSPAMIAVLGGGAIALYGVSSGTTDIDTWNTLTQPLEDAIARARVVTGLNIPVKPVGVAGVPQDFEDRWRREPGPWTHLMVLKPEPHDLALSKADRGVEHDFAGIEALHGVEPLDLETLVTRYINEMGELVGDRAQRDVKFILMIERLYGEIEAERVENRLRAHRERQAQSPLHRR